LRLMMPARFDEEFSRFSTELIMPRSEVRILLIPPLFPQFRGYFWNCLFELEPPVVQHTCNI